MDEEIDLLTGWQTRVFKPRPVDKTLVDCIVSTVDSEYRLPFLFPTPPDYEEKYGTPYPKQGEQFFQPPPFLTFQFGAQTPDGRIIAHGVKVNPPITRKMFLREFHGFLDANKIKWRGKRVVIGAHVSRMELQHLSPLPPIKDYGDDSWECWLDRRTVVIDTSKLFGNKVSLAKATEGSPFQKVSLEGFQGRPESYWRGNPDALFQEHPDKFWEYALGDAKALLWRLLDLRRFVWERWHIDLFRVHSAAGLSCRILQSRLKEPLEPAVRQQFLDSNERPRTRVVFDPELIEARRTALKAYSGGRREAYIQGFVQGPIFVFDFSKQYTTAALATPLPTGSTKIERLESVEDCKRMVGWARVKFKFPAGSKPCIGVKDPRFPKLVFVREGETWTGVFSIRRALEKGAQIEFIEGWGFAPTEREQNHPVHTYFRELLALGKQLGGFYELFTKSLANALIGRTVAKVDVGDEEEELWLKSPRRVMASFAPIHACLILDHAKALEDQLIDLTARPIYTHTDSVFTLNPIDLQHPFIQYIRSLGGDVRLEMTAPYAWILRAAVAYLPNMEPSGKPKAPHHAIDCQKPDYIRTIEIMLQRPELTPRFAKIRYVTLREHENKEYPLAAYRIHGMRPRLEWDNKRKLVGEPLKGAALWSGQHVETEPWESVEEILQNYRPRGSNKQTASERAKRLTGRVGRPNSIPESDRVEIIRLAQNGIRPNEIIQRFPHVNKRAIYRITSRITETR